MAQASDLLLNRAREIENIPAGIALLQQLEDWWAKESLRTLVGGIESEAIGLRQRSYNTLVYSCRKYSMVLKAVERLLGYFRANCTIEELFESLTFVIVGSLGRYEAEMKRSDIDADIVFCCSNDKRKTEYVHQAHTHLVDQVRQDLTSHGVEGYYLDVQHAFNYSYEDLRRHVAREDYSHLYNLLLTGKPLTNSDRYQREVNAIISRMTPNGLYEGLLEVLRTLVAKDVQDLRKAERQPLDVIKLMYHVMTYLMQILAFLFIPDEPLKSARLNYWRICELLLGQPDVRRPQWRRLRRGVVSSMKMRDYDASFPSDEREKARQHILRAYSTAVRLSASRGFVIYR